MATSDPIPSLLIQCIDADSLVDTVTQSLVDKLGPMLQRSDGPFLINRENMAMRLDVSTPTVDKLVREQRIPSVMIGSRRLFDPQAVIAALSVETANRTKH